MITWFALKKFHRMVLLTGALRMTTVFNLKRPKAHYGTNGEIKDRFKNIGHQKKPDLSKLIRAAEDALTGVIYKDDSQICEHHSYKKYSEKIGVQIIIEQVKELENGKKDD